VSQFTIYLDIAGRITREIAVNRYVTVAGVAISTERVRELREKIPEDLPKWRDCSDSDAQQITNLIIEESVAALVLRVRKSPNEWEEFWNQADDFHHKAATAEKRKIGYIKAATVIKYSLFLDCSALVLAEAVKAAGSPLVLDPNGLGIVDSTIICDTDIQGKESLEVFESMSERSCISSSCYQ
jgi:hypothetical protein